MVQQRRESQSRQQRQAVFVISLGDGKNTGLDETDEFSNNIISVKLFSGL